MLPTNPPAIVWTAASEPSPQPNLSSYTSIDIPALHAWVEREAELSSFRNLEDDWDGFDAAKPDPAVIDRAIAFMRNLRSRTNSNAPKRIVLSPDGFIALEWMESNRFIQAEVGESNEAGWMVATPGQPTQFWVESIEALPYADPTEGFAWQPPARIVVDEPVYA